MTKKMPDDNNYDEAGEKRLAELIKEAGDDMRMSNKKARERHYAKIREVVEEAVSSRQDFITK